MAWRAESGDAGPDGRSHQTDLQSRPRSVSMTDSAGSRGPCASAADHRAAPGQGRSVALLGRRQIGSALGLRVVSEYLWRTCHHPAGNGDALASHRLAIVLALDVAQIGTTKARHGFFNAARSVLGRRVWRLNGGCLRRTLLGPPLDHRKIQDRCGCNRIHDR